MEGIRSLYSLILMRGNILNGSKFQRLQNLIKKNIAKILANLLYDTINGVKNCRLAMSFNWFW